ncbi:unnamed protein product [Urochloa humidicola]
MSDRSQAGQMVHGDRVQLFIKAAYLLLDVIVQSGWDAVSDLRRMLELKIGCLDEWTRKL